MHSTVGARSSMPEPSTSAPKRRKHVIVLTNGLWGRTHHWATVQSYLTERLKESREEVEYHVHVSSANQLFDTYAGIDVCGDRLRDELDEVIRKDHADADAISFVGHSMGGLICRNTIAKAFDQGKKKLVIGGRELQPMHYLSLATPHVGFGPVESCPMEHAWYIPFSRWIVPYVSSKILGDAGKQFFLRDDNKLILRMAGGEWLESLRSFKTRTAYGNVAGDHLVGWGNSCLRSRDETREMREGIEALRDATHRGVVREDAIELSTVSDPGPPSARPGALRAPESQEDALINLCALSWRRVDCSFKHSRLPGIAHQHIMVQRPRLNGVGRQTARHLADQLRLCVVCGWGRIPLQTSAKCMVRWPTYLDTFLTSARAHLRQVRRDARCVVNRAAPCRHGIVRVIDHM